MLIFISAIYLRNSWVDLVGALFILPQIIHTAFEGKKKSIPFKFILFCGIPRIGFTVN